MSSQRWGVVGGGMLGMTLAMWLRDRGHEVTIIEAADRLGGLASAWEIGDVTWDRHYHVILSSDVHLLALLDRLGLTDDLRWVETRTGVLSGGRLFSVSNAIEYLKYPPLRMIDKMRMAWTILYGSRLKDWRSLELIPVEDWLRRHSGDRAFETFWLPLLRAKLGDNYRRTSAAFIWTTIQRLYTGAPQRAQERDVRLRHRGLRPDHRSLRTGVGGARRRTQTRDKGFGHQSNQPGCGGRSRRGHIGVRSGGRHRRVASGRSTDRGAGIRRSNGR